MRTWSIILSGAAVAAGLTTSAPAREVAAAGVALPVMGKSFSGQHIGHLKNVRPGTIIHRSAPRFQNRWFVGWHTPGGWAAFRRPMVGYVLPAYWINPAYRNGVHWQEHDDDQSPPPGMIYDDDVTAPDAPSAPPPLEYEGRWSGTWRDEEGRTYSGEYEGRFEGDVRSRYGVEYDAPPYASLPDVVHHGGPGQPVVTTTHAPGYFAGGYYYPGATTTTVVVQPAVTTTKTYVTEVRTSRRHGMRMRRNCNCK